MTSLSYTELTAAVRREGEAIVAAGKQGLDVEVETCGEWELPDLLLHVAGIYHRVATVVGQRLMSPVSVEPAPEGSDPVGYLADTLDELVHALSDATADAPAWNWSGQDQTAAFWARRMAHESAVHRFDAQRAHGLAQPLDAELAFDGFDELVDLILPSIIRRDSVALPTGVYSFIATDDGAWHLRLGPDGLDRLEVAKEPDVVIRGTVSALLLAAYGRVPWTSQNVDGDAALLDGWSAAFNF